MRLPLIVSQSFFRPEGIFTDKVEDLALVGPIFHDEDLECVVGSQWVWFGQYDDELSHSWKWLIIPELGLKNLKFTSRRLILNGHNYGIEMKFRFIFDM